MQHTPARPAALRRFSIAFIASAGIAACAVDAPPTTALVISAHVPQNVPLDLAPPIDTSDPILALAGTIIVRASDGAERRDVDGTLRIHLMSPGGGDSTNVDIMAGRWQLDLFHDSDGHLVTAKGQRLGQADRVMEYYAMEATISGEGVNVHPLRGPYRPLKFGQHDVALLVRCPVPVKLSVRDETTGEHLDGVCIVVSDSIMPLFGMEPYQASTPVHLVARDARSPFSFTPPTRTLPLPDGPQTYNVTCPGYASQAITIDLYSGGSRPVLLRPADPQETQPAYTLHTGPAGVAAEPAQCGTESVETSGSGTRRAIDRALLAMQSRARELSALAPELSEAPAPALLRPAPELVRISVAFVDDSTGTPTRARGLRWSDRTEVPVAWESSRHVMRDVDDTHFRFDVPAGPIRLHVGSHYWHKEVVVVAAAGAEFIFDVDADAEAVASIRLVDGETRVPWVQLAHDALTRLDGGALQGSSGCVQGEAYVCNERPGRHRLRIPRINGYEPHPPVEFDLIGGQTTEIVVELVRSP